jgi:hypothetical protein
MSRARLSILSASLLIVACSGGTDQFGKEGSGPATGTFDITSTNGLAATKVAWESVVASGELTDLGGGLPISSAGSGGLSKVSLTRPAGLAVSVIQNVPFGPFESPCASDGSITISGDIADPLLSTLTFGDTFTVLSTMCDEGLGEVVDGLIEFTVGDFTGDLAAGTYLLSMDAVVTNLQVMTAADTLTSTGDATVSLDTSASPFIDASTSGTSMTTDSNASSETISNYRSNQTVDGNQQNLPYTMAASGTLNTTQLEGIVTYSTPVEFNGEGVDYPLVGVLLVQGTNSSARLTAIDNVNVMIELDVNGDGEADQTINTTWVDLTT